MSSVVIAGDTSGTITLQAPAVSGSTTLTLPATSGTVLTSASAIPTSSITGVLSVANGGTGISTAAAAGGTVSPGTILDFGGISAPSGYLGCDGSNVSRTTYATLFAAIGTAWGVGDGSTTFGVPDLRRKVAVGSGGTGTARLANSVGSTGGEESHVQNTAEMAAHGHRFSGGTHGAGLGGSNYGTCVGFPALAATYGYTNTFGSGVIGIETSGSGSAFNVMQPSSVVLKIIKT